MPEHNESAGNEYIKERVSEYSQAAWREYNNLIASLNYGKHHELNMYRDHMERLDREKRAKLEKFSVDLREVMASSFGSLEKALEESARFFNLPFQDSYTDEDVEFAREFITKLEEIRQNLISKGYSSKEYLWT